MTGFRFLFLLFLGAVFSSLFFKPLRSGGVQKHDPLLTSKGLTLFSTNPGNTAEIIDLDGRLIHRWENPSLSDFVFSSSQRRCMYKNQHLEDWPLYKCAWHFADVDREKNLLVIAGQQSLAKLDWSSKPIWSVRGFFHHDLDRGPDGTIYVLEKAVFSFPFSSKQFKITDEFISTISQNGERLRHFSLLPLFEKDLPKNQKLLVRRYLDSTEKKQIDPYNGENFNLQDFLHSNSIQLIDFDIPGICRRGDFLISLRKLNVIAIIDGVQKKIRWRIQSDLLQGQHAPNLSADGKLLVLDNRREEGASRIIEIDVATNRVSWSFAPGPDEFYTANKGSIQRLDNGNILVTSSEQGEIFEITRQGKKVWRYRTPLFKNAVGKFETVIPLGAKRLPLSLFP
jgi:hypothetical protein